MEIVEAINALKQYEPSIVLDDVEGLEALEKLVEKMKEKLQAKAKDLLNNKKKLVVNGVVITRVDVYEKVADLDAINQKFVKIEKKLNTAVVNEYLKENKTLPEGVTEYKKYSRFCMKVIKPIENKEKGKFKVVEGSQKAIENLKSLSKNIKTRGTDKAESNLPF